MEAQLSSPVDQQGLERFPGPQQPASRGALSVASLVWAVFPGFPTENDPKSLKRWSRPQRARLSLASQSTRELLHLPCQQGTLSHPKEAGARQGQGLGWEWAGKVKAPKWKLPPDKELLISSVPLPVGGGEHLLEGNY